MFMLETNLETRKLTVRYLKNLLKSVLQNWFKALPQLRSERLALQHKEVTLVKKFRLVRPIQS
jgi:hypothetical protein